MSDEFYFLNMNAETRKMWKIKPLLSHYPIFIFFILFSPSNKNRWWKPFKPAIISVNNEWNCCKWKERELDWGIPNNWVLRCSWWMHSLIANPLFSILMPSICRCIIYSPILGFKQQNKNYNRVEPLW